MEPEMTPKTTERYRNIFSPPCLFSVMLQHDRCDKQHQEEVKRLCRLRPNDYRKTDKRNILNPNNFHTLRLSKTRINSTKNNYEISITDNKSSRQLHLNSLQDSNYIFKIFAIHPTNIYAIYVIHRVDSYFFLIGIDQLVFVTNA